VVLKWTFRLPLQKENICWMRKGNIWYCEKMRYIKCIFLSGTYSEQYMNVHFKEVFTFIYGVSIKVCMSSWSLIFCLLSVGSECNKIQPWNTVKHVIKIWKCAFIYRLKLYALFIDGEMNKPGMLLNQC
jgi:hypothetical protein